MVSKINYSKKSAGRIMFSNVPVINYKVKIEDVKKLLLKNDFESINYIYLLDNEKKIKGILSIRNVFRSPLKKKTIKFAKTNIISVRANTDQEKVALLSLQHNIKAVPVVNKKNEFLGVVTNDTIIDILQSEHIEDELKKVGSLNIENPEINLIKAGVGFHFKKRIPWLILGVFGGILAAFIVELFEGSLMKEIMLAAFIPVIVYMADAVGNQSQTIFIRSISLDSKLNIEKYFFKELKINFFMSIILSLIISLFSFFWLKSFNISLILGISLFLTVIVSMLFAIILPLLFKKINIDPAIASGPFATILRDMTSLIIYFTVAYILI